MKKHRKGSRNMFFVYGVVRPRGNFRLCRPILLNQRHRSDW